jgi:hypothetical protein
MTASLVTAVITTMVGGLRLCPPSLLLDLNGAQPMPINHLGDVCFHLREERQGLLKFEQRTDVMLFALHARRFLADLLISKMKKQGGKGRIYNAILKGKRIRTASAGI